MSQISNDITKILSLPGGGATDSSGGSEPSGFAEELSSAAGAASASREASERRGRAESERPRGDDEKVSNDSAPKESAGASAEEQVSGAEQAEEQAADDHNPHEEAGAEEEQAVIEVSAEVASVVVVNQASPVEQQLTTDSETAAPAEQGDGDQTSDSLPQETETGLPGQSTSGLAAEVEFTTSELAAAAPEAVEVTAASTTTAGTELTEAQPTPEEFHSVELAAADSQAAANKSSPQDGADGAEQAESVAETVEPSGSNLGEEGTSGDAEGGDDAQSSRPAAGIDRSVGLDDESGAEQPQKSNAQVDDAKHAEQPAKDIDLSAAEKPTARSEGSSLQATSSALDRIATGRLPAARAEAAGGDTPRVEAGKFVSRVSRAVSAAQQRGGEVRLRLSPPELGSLQIKLTMSEGAMTATLETETAAARNLLLDNLPALRERLAEQQIRVEKFDVDVRQDGGRQQDTNPEQRQSGSPDDRQSGSGGDSPRTDPRTAGSEDATEGPRASLDPTGSGEINLVA